MPITKAAKKALRQSQRRKARNLRPKRKMRALVKQVRALASNEKKDEAQKLLPQTYKALDKAAKAGLIKKNTASRRKSRLTKLFQREQTPQQTSAQPTENPAEQPAEVPKDDRQS